jgi:hypothetical protein
MPPPLLAPTLVDKVVLQFVMGPGKGGLGVQDMTGKFRAEMGRRHAPVLAAIRTVFMQEKCL